jgi:signal peptidase
MSNTLKYFIYIVVFIMVPLAAFSILASKTTLIPNIKSFIVMSGSMEPTLPVGSMIYTQKMPTYKAGDIISFKNSDGVTVTHRIIGIKSNNKVLEYVTLGDANDTPDSSTVPYTSVIGKSIFVVPQIGSLIVYLKTPFGFLSLLMAPCLAFILFEFLNLKKEMEKEIERKILSRLQQ